MSQDFLGGLLSHSFFPCISKPTRLATNSATLIDNIFLNADSVTESGVIITDISDHFPIFACLPSFFVNSTDLSQPKLVRRINQGKILCLKEKLSLVDWNVVLGENDTNIAYDKFIDILIHCFNECIPLRRNNRNKNKQARQPWISKSLLRSINRKNNLYYRFRSNPTEVTRKKYTNYRNILTTLLRIEKNRYFFSQFDLHKNNMKDTWKTINNVLQKANQNKHPSRFFFMMMLYMIIS